MALKVGETAVSHLSPFYTPLLIYCEKERNRGGNLQKKTRKYKKKENKNSTKNVSKKKFFLLLLVAFLVESLFSFLFLVFLMAFLVEFSFLLFSYFLVFFHKFPPQIDSLSLFLFVCLSLSLSMIVCLPFSVSLLSQGRFKRRDFSPIFSATPFSPTFGAKLKSLAPYLIFRSPQPC